MPRQGDRELEGLRAVALPTACSDEAAAGTLVIAAPRTTGSVGGGGGYCWRAQTVMCGGAAPR